MPERSSFMQADCRLAAFAVNLCAFGAPFGLPRLTARAAKLRGRSCQ
jgi:hypothetical protein